MPAANRFQQVGGAVVNYAEVYRQVPPAVHLSKEGQPLLSWRVLLLPFLEYENIYIKFNLDEPWDGPTNKPLLSEMPHVYARPGREGTASPTCGCSLAPAPGSNGTG